MIHAIGSDKPLPTISIIKAMEMLILVWDDVSATKVQNYLEKPGIFMTTKR